MVVGGAEYSGGDEHAEEDERGGAEQAPGLVPAKLHLNHQNLQLFMITTELGTRQIFSFATTATRHCIYKSLRDKKKFETFSELGV